MNNKNKEQMATATDAKETTTVKVKFSEKHPKIAKYAKWIGGGTVLALGALATLAKVFGDDPNDDGNGNPLDIPTMLPVEPPVSEEAEVIIEPEE